MAGALDCKELLPIELLQCGTTPPGALDHEELLGVELLEFGTTLAGALDHEELLHVELEIRLLEVEVASPSCRELPQVPQGTTALSTPPFVRAGYDCRNNTTVWRRPEAAGWAPLV